MSGVIHRLRQWVFLLALVACSGVWAGSYEEFFEAVRQDDAAAVQRLLARSFDPNTLDPTGATGLLLATKGSAWRVVDVLLQQPGIKVEVRNASDESPLMLAALRGELALCERLIAMDADVNKPGWTALHYAATNGHTAVMQLLLEHHAYLDATSPNQTTPLMMAAHYGTPGAVKLLLEAGADPMLKNDQGLSALDFANRASRKEAADIIAAFVRARQPKGSW